jgi:hypothetical protein
VIPVPGPEGQPPVLLIGPAARRAFQAPPGTRAREADDLFEALALLVGEAPGGCLVDAACLAARPASGLQLLRERLAGAPLLVVDEGAAPGVQRAADRLGVPRYTPLDPPAAAPDRPRGLPRADGA